MRSNLLKFIAMLVILTMGASFGSTALASDDYYPIVVDPGRFGPPAGGGIGCPEGAANIALAVQGGTLVVTFPRQECVANVVIEVNPVIYNGPAPVTGILRLPIPVLDETNDTITASLTLVDGKTAEASIKYSAAAVAAANGVPLPAASVPAAVAVPAGSGTLALTGVDSNVPLTVGLLLTGTGGLALLAARKRRQD